MITSALTPTRSPTHGSFIQRFCFLIMNTKQTINVLPLEECREQTIRRGASSIETANAEYRIVRVAKIDSNDFRISRSIFESMPNTAASL